MLKRTICILLIGTIVSIAQSGELKFVVKPYIQNISTEGVAILWETNIPSSGIVNFGIATHGRNSVLFDNKKISDALRKTHTIQIASLTSESKYFYQVIINSGLDTIRHKVNQFMTAVESNRPITFAVFGDTQQQKDPTVWNRVSKLALNERPNFGLIVGDLVDTGGELNQWRFQFLSNGNEFMESIPLFPVIGNHDIINDEEAKNFNKYMKHPGEEKFYSVKYGNVQLFILDSNQDMEPGSKQYAWLENELAESKSMWKIAAHHHAPYSSDNDDYGSTDSSLPLDGDPNFIPIIPLYEKYNVDIVFYGHIHSYERTWALLEKSVNENGVVYVQCGGAGGNNEFSGVIRSWFSAKLKSDNHFCLISINGMKLYMNAIDDKGVLFDQYIIDKNNIPLKKCMQKEIYQ